MKNTLLRLLAVATVMTAAFVAPSNAVAGNIPTRITEKTYSPVPVKDGNWVTFKVKLEMYNNRRQWVAHHDNPPADIVFRVYDTRSGWMDIGTSKTAKNGYATYRFYIPRQTWGRNQTRVIVHWGAVFRGNASFKASSQGNSTFTLIKR